MDKEDSQSRVSGDDPERPPVQAPPQYGGAILRYVGALDAKAGAAGMRVWPMRERAGLCAELLAE
jgi:hypothetical protein